MSAKAKLHCLVCGQDVFGKSVVHVQRTRREVTSTGWCRQCGYGVRRSEVFEVGKPVRSTSAILNPERNGWVQLRRKGKA